MMVVGGKEWSAGKSWAKGLFDPDAHGPTSGNVASSSDGGEMTWCFFRVSLTTTGPAKIQGTSLNPLESDDIRYSDDFPDGIPWSPMTSAHISLGIMPGRPVARLPQVHELLLCY